MPFYSYSSLQLAPPAADAWGTVDRMLAAPNTLLKDLLPSNTIGLVVRPIGGAGFEFCGLRHPDSTDSRTGDINGNAHCWCVVKCNSNKEFEFYRGSTAVTIYLEGYITDQDNDVVLFTNATEKTPAPNNAWSDIDLAALCPGAIGIIYEVQGDSGWMWDARNNESTSGRNDVAGEHGWGIMGCDASQIMEYYKGIFGTDPQKLFILGYIKDNGSFKVNWTDITPGAGGVWTDKDLSGETDIYLALVHAESVSGSTQTFGARQKGDTGEPYKTVLTEHSFAIVPVDASGYIQVKVSATTLGVYLIGILKYLAPPPLATPGNVGDPLVKGSFI